MPKGSVRAILALGTLGSFVAVVTMGMGEIAIAALSPIAVMVMKDYFQTRNEDETTE